MKYFLSFLLFVFVLPASAQSISLDEAVAKALANNPQIQAAREEAKAAKARVPQAITPENPDVSIEFEKTPINTFNVGDAMSKNYRIEQKLPFPTKLISKGSAAKNESRAAKNIEEQIKLMVIAEVKKTYFDIILTDKKIELEKQNQNLFKRYKGVAETKYATGRASFDDPIKASLEVGGIESKLSELEQERSTLAANLGYLLGGNLEDVVLKMPETSAFNKKLPELLSTAAKREPSLKAAEFLKQAAKNKESLAKQEYLPDITAMLEYNQQSGLQNAWTSSFGISVPLWFFGRQQPAIREAHAMKKVFTKQYEDAKNKLNFMVTDAFERISSAKRIIEIYKSSILPKAKAALRSVETSYVTGKTDFLNLADSARRYREFELDYWQALTNYEKSVAEMEAFVGGKL